MGYCQYTELRIRRAQKMGYGFKAYEGTRVCEEGRLSEIKREGERKTPKDNRQLVAYSFRRECVLSSDRTNSWLQPETGEAARVDGPAD